MSDRLRDIPKLARDGRNLQAAFDAVQEALQTFRGYRGDPLDRALTLRDVAGGQIAFGNGVGGGVQGPVGPPGPAGPPGGEYTPDLTAPPTATGLVLTAGLSYLYIQCDAQVYTQGHGHDRTVVYGAKWPTGEADPTFASAVQMFDFKGTFSAYPTDPGTRWKVWIKWRSMDGVLSVAPSLPAVATTGQDVSKLLEVLSGQITESQLYAALNARINLIDAPSGTSGSVNARILAEQTARTSSYSALASDITTLYASAASNASGVSTNAAAISNEATVRANADTALSNTITTVQATLGSDISAAVAVEASARAAVDGHLAAQYTARMQITQDGRTVVGGFGVTGTSGGTEGPTIDVGVIASKFWIGPLNGAAPGVTSIVPFVVQTSDEIVNGVVIPKGVYIDAAYIKNLSAMVARLGNAWIDDAKIASLSAEKVTFGTMSGNRIAVDTLNGNRILAQSIDAGKIDTRGLTIKDASGNIIFGSGAGIDPSSYMSVPNAWKNSNVTVGADGTLYGAGGGKVTIGGLGYSGAMDATKGATIGADLYGQINSGNVGTYIADATILAAKIASLSVGLMSTAINGGAASGARVEMASNVVRVYDSSNVLRVKIGNLS